MLSRKQKIKLIISKIPLIERYLYKKKYKNELALIKDSHQNSNLHPSIIHFSFNKAATQYVKSILKKCVIKNGMVYVDIHEYAFHSNFPYLSSLSCEQMKQYQHIFKSQGYLYSAFGGMIEGISNLENYKIVLVARDPRDILVSEYYSIAYSHTAPSKNENKYNDFIARRAEARSSTIDEYVISNCKRVYENYYRYQVLLLDKYKNIFLTKYEEMVSNFDVWLMNLITYCELNLSEEFIQSLIKENEAKKPKQEKINNHTRKGIVGDYKAKLQPKTIQILNKKFHSIIKRYHFQH